MLIVPSLIGMTAKIPEIAIVFLLFLVYGLLPASFTPQISLGPGGVKLHELAILLLTAIAFIKNPSFDHLKKYSLWTNPVYLFLFLTVSAFIIGMLVYGTAAKDVLQEARAQMSWLLVFVTIYLIHTATRINRITWGLVILGLALAIAVLAQFVTGQSFIQNARVEGLNTLNTTYSDMNRSTAGGGIYMILFPIFYIIARLLTKSISIYLSILILTILTAGVIVTFGRGIWITTIIVGLFLSKSLSGWGGVVKYTISLVIGASAALMLLAAYKPEIIAVTYERILSTTQEGSKNSSLGWRLEETEFAIKTLIKSPVFGIGYGTPYKPYFRLGTLESSEMLVRYIHNGYLGLWMKLGIFGPIAAIWLIITIIKRGSLLIKKASDPKIKSLAAALTAGFMVPTLTGFTQPEWLAPTGVTFFAIMLGLLVSIERMLDSKTSSTTNK
jgi:O-antigen ligase